MSVRLVSVLLAGFAGIATACFKPAIEQDASAGDTFEETQDSSGVDAAQDDLCQGDECSPVGCPEEPVAGPGRWARVFAEGPLVPLAAARLASGDLVVAGLVEAGEVTFPDLGGASLADANGSEGPRSAAAGDVGAPEDAPEASAEAGAGPSDTADVAMGVAILTHWWATAHGHVI